MSNNQITQTNTISLEEMTVKQLTRMLSADFKISRLSTLRKGHLVRIAKHLHVVQVTVTTDVNVYGVEVTRFAPVFAKVAINKDNKKVKTTKEAFSLLASSPSGQSVVADVATVMATGVKLIDICKTPEEYLKLANVSTIKRFVENFNPYYVAIPTREMGLVFVSELTEAVVKDINGNKEVVVAPRLELRAQNHLIDALCKKYVFITRNEETGDIVVIDKHQARAAMAHGKEVKRVRDMRYILSMDYNLPVLKGEKELTRDQRFIQSRAIINGVFFDLNGRYLNAEYFMASASERRTVMGTHIIHLDAVEALHTLGMDFRQFAKFDGVRYTLDMIKAPSRFGLASTSSIPSSLIKIGKTIKEYDNGEYAIVGGTHTMKVAKDVYSYVRNGKYLAYDAANDTFMILDAEEIPFKRNVTDGLIFADASIQFAINAEFGKLISSEQVRITPATKGLVVFVPGLKEMVGHDLLAFESATKGDYRTLLTTNPEFDIEFRIAIFGKNAKDDKNKTNIPYQMIQTMFTHEHAEDLRKKLDIEIEEAFKVYDSPEKLAQYLGTKTLDVFEGLSEDEVTEEQREVIDGTLVSMFSNFFHVGDFVMEDPYFKKRLLDIIENMIRAWTRGAMPIEGHYRFMVTDVYGVMESYRQGTRDMKSNKVTDFVEYDEKGKATILVPSHVGIPANHVVMVDDNDQYFLDGQEIVFNRNPKISMKETAKATGIITKDYYMARKAYPFAFNNLVMFSCHDFNVVKQGGADFDGDKCHASTDSVMVNSFKPMPALLDLTLVNGEYIEGCPFQPKTMAEYDFFGSKYRSDVAVDGVQYNDEFKVTFTDADYNMDFARQVHELSKVFVLRTLDPNQIGQLTNFATQILAAISRLEYSLAHGVDVHSNPLTADTKDHYLDEINKMTAMVDKLRLLQGWEIDKAKHGGAFWDELKEQLLFITDSEHYPTYASYTHVTDKGLKQTRFAPLEWHKAAKSRKSLQLREGFVYPSLVQELRSHVLLSFATKIKARFKQLNPSTDTNNLVTRFAPVANVYSHVTVQQVLVLLKPIFEQYGKSQLEIMNARKRFEQQREDMNFRSKLDADRYDRRTKQQINTMMDRVVSTAQSQVKALPFDQATIAYIAYAKKYREYRPSKAASPASGLSFPWVVCRDGMLELVSRVSGKSTQLVTFEPIIAADVTIRLGNFEMPADKIQALFASSSTADVSYETDAVTGNYLPFVYIGGQRVATLFDDSTLYFTGAERFAFEFDNFTLSATGKSASVLKKDVVRH